VSTSKQWGKFAKSKRYREEFVGAQVKKSIPLQIRTLLKQHSMSQETLAQRAGVTQGVVSRAASLDYGNLTLNTLIRIAAGFDLAFIGKFAPFTELEQWFADFSEESLQVKTFEEENAELMGQEELQHTTASTEDLGLGQVASGQLRGELIPFESIQQRIIPQPPQEQVKKQPDREMRYPVPPSELGQAMQVGLR
jgi:transcriptional regulator with XRE-family HTH domain